MGMKRRVYSNEFKIQAVKMIVDKRMSCAEVARQLGVNSQLQRTPPADHVIDMFVSLSEILTH